MAKNETKRIQPAILQIDRQTAAALQSIVSYKPANASYAAGEVAARLAAMDAARATEAQAQAALDTARDNAVAAEWAFHNLILGVKDQVIAQFGSDSNEVQMLGLKKKSERKAPTRKVRVKA